MKYCKDCEWFEQSETCSYCLIKDLYTETQPNDPICEDFEHKNKE